MLPAPPYRKALIVANPVSGQGRGKSAGAELREGLGLQGLPTELHLTQRSQDARARVQALEEEIDLVVSVGGDGTLREVLTGLRERPADAPPVRVGVLPMGTGNALCADLGLPRDVDRALEVLLGGKTAEMDVADVNGELSFLVTGVGPDALVVEDVDEHRKGRSLSKWAYLPSSLRSLWRYRREPLTVELDGETLPGTFSQVLASNLIHYGGLMKLCPGRVLDDGLFEVFLFRGQSRLQLIVYALRVFLGLVPGGSISMRRASRIRVTSRRPVPYHVDGDPMGATPVQIEVTGTRFQLLVP